MFLEVKHMLMCFAEIRLTNKELILEGKNTLESSQSSTLKTGFQTDQKEKSLLNKLKKRPTVQINLSYLA